MEAQLHATSLAHWMASTPQSRNGWQPDSPWTPPRMLHGRSRPVLAQGNDHGELCQILLDHQRLMHIINGSIPFLQIRVKISKGKGWRGE
uniref:Uncharacterized protein n=1 Tax=Arundo donax TaxID=35708 RepID=A0A0A9D9K2_ARUDO